MARRIAFTELQLQKLRPPSAGQVELFDARAPGLSIKVGTSGAKTFFVTYRVKGDRKRRRGFLGRYGEITLAEARTRRLRALALAREGDDPFPAQGSAEDARDKFKFDACVERFINNYLARTNKRPEEGARILRSYFVSVWGGRDIRTIEWSDVEKVLDDIGSNHGHVASNRAFGRIRKFFNWQIASASAKDRLPHSPCDRQKPLFREASRERVLTNAELVRLWLAAENMGYPYGPIFMLWTLLGQRRSEVAGMRWDQVDFQERRWVIPGRSTKNSEPHVLPLPDQAIRIISTCYRIVGTPFVFPSARSLQKPISGFSAMKHELDGLSGVSDWTPHDLRRTQATRLAGIFKVPVNIIDLIHNHKSVSGSQVSKIYVRYGYLDEQQDALQRWANYVEQTVGHAEGQHIMSPTKVRRTHARAAQPCYGDKSLGRSKR